MDGIGVITINKSMNINIKNITIKYMRCLMVDFHLKLYGTYNIILNLYILKICTLKSSNIYNYKKYYPKKYNHKKYIKNITHKNINLKGIYMRYIL